VAHVLAADIRDREEGTVRLRPLAGNLPRLPVLRVETGDDGAPLQPWVNAYLTVHLEVITPPWTGARGVWAPEGGVGNAPLPGSHTPVDSPAMVRGRR